MAIGGWSTLNLRKHASQRWKIEKGTVVQIKCMPVVQSLLTRYKWQTPGKSTERAGYKLPASTGGFNKQQLRGKLALAWPCYPLPGLKIFQWREQLTPGVRETCLHSLSPRTWKSHAIFASPLHFPFSLRDKGQDCDWKSTLDTWHSFPVIKHRCQTPSMIWPPIPTLYTSMDTFYFLFFILYITKNTFWPPKLPSVSFRHIRCVSSLETLCILWSPLRGQWWSTPLLSHLSSPLLRWSLNLNQNTNILLLLHPLVTVFPLCLSLWVSAHLPLFLYHNMGEWAPMRLIHSFNSGTVLSSWEVSWFISVERINDCCHKQRNLFKISLGLQVRPWKKTVTWLRVWLRVRMLI